MKYITLDTIYKDSVYFIMPDMSLENSQGISPNFYNLGESTDDFRYYMCLEAGLFDQINLLIDQVQLRQLSLPFVHLVDRLTERLNLFDQLLLFRVVSGQLHL